MKVLDSACISDLKESQSSAKSFGILSQVVYIVSEPSPSPEIPLFTPSTLFPSSQLLKVDQQWSIYIF
jgi:hypothetical protein